MRGFLARFRSALVVFTLALVGLTVVSSVAFGGTVYAQQGPFDDICASGNTSGTTVCANKDKKDNFISGQDGILLKAAKLITWGVGIASIIMIMIGGLKYILANGDASSIASAKNTILYALIGVMIALVSQTIISFVLKQV